jgi:hypothetical protein
LGVSSAIRVRTDNTGLVTEIVCHGISPQYRIFCT